ncbi:MAG: trigger factor [Elusimicrobiota bacterium]
MDGEQLFKVDVVKEEPCSVTFNIAIPVEEVKQVVEKNFEEIQQAAELPGFRRGKAPLSMIKTNFSQKAREKSLDQLVSSSLSWVLRQRSLSPVSYPLLKELNFDFDKEFCYTVTIETVPKFELEKYFGLELTKEKEVVTPQKVEMVIKNIQKDFAQLEPAKQDTVAGNSVVVVDYKFFSPQSQKWSEEIKNQLIDLNEPALPPEVAGQMAGLKIGEEKEVEIPKTNQRYFFKVVGLKERVLPVLDDQFAKDLGFSDFETVKKKVEENLEKQLEQDSAKKLEENLLDKLIEVNKFPVPSSLVEKRLERIVESMYKYFLKNGGDQQKWEEERPKLREKYSALAERLVRLSFILSAIIKKEKISVTDEEVNNKIEQLVNADASQKEETKKYLQENKENVNLQLEEESVIKLLLDKAKIKTVIKKSE